MRWIPTTIATIAISILSGCATTTSPATSLYWAHAAEKCSGNDPDDQIRQCTALIQSGTETADNIAIEFYDRGTAYLKKGDRNSAFRDASEALKINHNMAPAYRLSGDILLMENKPTVAMFDFNEALALDPNGDWGDIGYVFAARGLAEAQLHIYDSAIRDLNRSVAIGAKGSQIFYYRGFTYAQAHKLDLAIADLSHAITFDPSLGPAYYERGAAYIRIRQYALAIPDLSKEIVAHPDWSYGWSERCRARTLAGDYTGASTDCRQALQLDLTSNLSLNAHGLVSLKLGNPTVAINDYTYALSIDPKSPSALYGRGLARRMAGDELSATQDIAAATALDPDIAEEFASYGLSAAEADLPFEVSTSKAAPDY